MLPEVDAVDAGITAQFVYDTRDAAFAPTRGLAATVEYMYTNDSLGADRDWQRLEAGARFALPLRGDVIWLAAAGGSNLGSDLPVDRFFTLGGPGSFPGLELTQYPCPGVLDRERQLSLEVRRHPDAARRVDVHRGADRGGRDRELARKASRLALMGLTSRVSTIRSSSRSTAARST